jgi:MFS family permease
MEILTHPEPDRMPVWALCVTQIISWGTLFYAFAVLLTPIGKGQGWRQEEMVGAYSLSLLISGLCAYPVGRWIQRIGGRMVMSLGSVMAGAAFGLIATSSSLAAFYAGWLVAGFAMACVLYEPAFATLAGIYSRDYKRAVTTVTLAGGFASTAFWPFTERLVAWLGWRESAWVFVLLHLGVCLPLHYFGLPQGRLAGASQGKQLTQITLSTLIRFPTFWLLAASYMLSSVVFAVLSVHLVPLFQTRGLPPHEAAWLAACAGPMQVLGRLVEFKLGHRWSGAQTGKVALSLVIPALLGLAIWPIPMAALMVAVGLFGISNGVMTIVRSVSVVEVFGRESYASVAGALMGPALVSRAFGPLLASMLMQRTGRYEPVLFALGCCGFLAYVLFSAAMRRRAFVAGEAASLKS